MSAAGTGRWSTRRTAERGSEAPESHADAGQTSARSRVGHQSIYDDGTTEARSRSRSDTRRRDVATRTDTSSKWSTRSSTRQGRATKRCGGSTPTTNIEEPGRGRPATDVGGRCRARQRQQPGGVPAEGSPAVRQPSTERRPAGGRRNTRGTGDALPPVRVVKIDPQPLSSGASASTPSMTSGLPRLTESARDTDEPREGEAGSRE